MIINRLRANQIAKLPEGKYLDGNGLYLRVQGNSRRWFLRFSFQGSRHDLGLGALPLADARAKAAEIRQQIAEGKHPLVTRAVVAATKKKEALAAKGLHTTLRDIYEDALQWYYEKNALRTPRWVHNGKALLESKVLPSIGLKPLTLITPQDIAAVLTPVWTSSTGGRMLTCLRACYRYATVKGLFTGSYPTDWEGALELLMPKASKVSKVEHRASCPWKDVPALYAQLAALPDTPDKRMTIACMLCVPRPLELADLRVADIDVEKRILVIQKSKTSTEPWEVPYPTQMDAVFDFTAEYPFGKKVSNHTAMRFLGANKVPYTAHGFRASFSSWCADHEKNPETREACLHHSIGGKVTLSYQRSNLLDLRRKLLQEWADYVTSTARAPS